MGSNNSYRELIVWQKSHELVKLVYRLTYNFPSKELFVLTSQFRRAAISVAANIVEGSQRIFSKEFIHFLNISRGSLGEVEYYSLLARDLGYITKDEFDKLTAKCEEIGKMLNGLISYLKDT